MGFSNVGATVSLASSRYAPMDVPNPGPAQNLGVVNWLQQHPRSATFMAGIPSSLCWLLDAPLMRWMAVCGERVQQRPWLRYFAQSPLAQRMAARLLLGAGMVATGVCTGEALDRANIPTIGINVQSSVSARNVAMFWPAMLLFLRSYGMSHPVVKNWLRQICNGSIQKEQLLKVCSTILAAQLGAAGATQFLLSADGANRSVLCDMHNGQRQANNNRDLKDENGQFDPSKVMAAFLTKMFQTSTNSGNQEMMKARVAGITRSAERVVVPMVFLWLRFMNNAFWQNTRLLFMAKDKTVSDQGESPSKEGAKSKE